MHASQAMLQTLAQSSLASSIVAKSSFRSETSKKSCTEPQLTQLRLASSDPNDEELQAMLQAAVHQSSELKSLTAQGAFGDAAAEPQDARNWMS